MKPAACSAALAVKPAKRRALVESVLVWPQISACLLERPKFSLKLGDKGAIIGGFTHGRAGAKNFQLLTDFFHRIGHLLAQRLF